MYTTIFINSSINYDNLPRLSTYILDDEIVREFVWIRELETVDNQGENFNVNNIYDFFNESLEKEEQYRIVSKIYRDLDFKRNYGLIELSYSLTKFVNVLIDLGLSPSIEESGTPEDCWWLYDSSRNIIEKEVKYKRYVKFKNMTELRHEKG